MKRIIALIFVLLTVSSLFIACKDEKTDDESTTTTTTTTGTEAIPPETVLHSSLYETDLSQYVTVPVKYEDLLISQAFLDDAVNSDVKEFLSYYGTVTEYEDAEYVTVEGDIVDIYYTGKAHDPSVTLSESTLKAMTNASSEETLTVTIGSGTLIGAYDNEEKPDLKNPGFEDQLIGHKKGDKYVLTVTCPDDYSNEELRGVVVDFEVEIVKVSHILETELTEELVKSNTNYETVDAFLKESYEYFKRYHTFQGLYDVIKVELPEDSKLDSRSVIIEFLFNDLGLTLTQGVYEEMLKEHYELNGYYYYYYYGIATAEALEKALGKDQLILYFEEELVMDKLVEYVTVID